MKELAVVMPVYNEEGVIGNVISTWSNMLDSLNIDYNIFAYNDGSIDNTALILDELSKKYSRLKMPYRQMQTGTVSIRKFKLLKVSVISFFQTIKCRYKGICNGE